MDKIIVIGSPGAGKSTFSRTLRNITGIPLYYLDLIFHNPDRTTATREAFDRKLHCILSQDKWIIDGNYHRTLPLRFEQCDTIFFFDLPVETCLKGAESRIGIPREDMPWVERTFDDDFRQYIIDFPRDQLPAIYELITNYQHEKDIIVFKSREEADAWLNQIV